MLIYEKNNKLNISFDNEVNENPDLQIGKSGDKTEVLVDGSSNSGLPEYDDTMEGAVLTLVQQPRVLIEAQTVKFKGGTGYFTHGFDTTGFVDGKTEASCTMNGTDCIFIWEDEDGGRFIYDKSSPTSYFIHPDGKINCSKPLVGNKVFSDITTTVGGELVPQWVGGKTSPVIDDLGKH